MAFLAETQLMTMVWPEARRVANLEISCRGMSLIKFRALVPVMDPAGFRL
jgi:SRSO17 transposase